MEKRLALIGIVVEDEEAVMSVNELLHKYRDSIIGRMGIPHRNNGVNLISIGIEASMDTINSLSGQLGKLSGVSTKTIYSNV